MKKTAFNAIALSVLSASFAGAIVSHAAHLDPDVVMQEGLVTSEEYEGVWQRTLTDGAVELKVIKDGYWAVKRRSDDGGEASIYHGGSFVVPGDVLVETIDFVDVGDTNRIGKSFVYRISVVDDVLKQSPADGKTDALEWDRIEIKKSTPKSSFSMGSIAMINVGTGSGASAGSGFVVEMDGKKYLMTNQHVLDSMSSIQIKTLENVQIRPVGFEVSRKLDLVRMEITNDIPALVIQQELPVIGDEITVYGNSSGGGVATKIKGKVLGVGPELIEVDAEFVQGNSGCPMLNANAQVTGVAAYATINEDPENLLSKNTRFQKVRRYGIRLNTADWTPVSPKLYQQQAQELSDQEHEVFMYAVTYLSIRYYVNQPQKYTYRTVTQNNLQTIERVERDKEAYDKEYARWQDFINRFNSVKPDSDLYYSDNLYKKCSSHYKKASEAFNTRNYDGREARAGKLNIQIESIYNIRIALAELKKKRYVSQHLLEKSDRILALCEYVIELHGKK